MPKRIKDLIAGTEQQYFVGRVQELEWMRSGLANAKSDWKLLHFYGVSGIGKTSLLKSFIRSSSSTVVFYFDGYSGFYHPIDFLKALYSTLREQGCLDENQPFDDHPLFWAEWLNRLSAQKQGIVLLLDTFERWIGLEDWLRDTWIPMLAAEVRICTAGRYPLQGRWLRGGWTTLVSNIKLHPLKRNEMDEYTLKYGITEPLIQEEIERFSGGFPILLSMICEIIGKQGVAAALDKTRQDHTVESLLQLIIQDLNNPEFEKYFEAASILLRFNQERLQTILGEEVTTENFMRFVMLPFIHSNGDGWRFHESVQERAQQLFRKRKPDTFQAYRKKALAMINREQINHPLQKNQLMMDKLYLHENELLRSYVFTGDDKGIEIRFAEQDDLPKLEALKARYFELMTNGTPDPLRLEQFIRPLWEADPTAFVTLWKEDELVAFYNFIQFTGETRKALEQVPVAQPFLKRGKQVEDKTWFALPLFAVVPSMQVEVGGLMSRIMLQHMGKAPLTIDITYLREWIPILQAAGFETLERASYTSPGGTKFECLQLDLRHHDLPSHIDQLFEQDEPLETAFADQAAELVKKTLTQFHELGFDRKLLTSWTQLHIQIGHAASEETTADTVKEKLRRSLTAMAAMSEEDKLSAEIIQLAYIKKASTHENIAKRLHLSNATYYRYLKKAIHRLAFYYLKKTD